jgi:hypothetical protein
MKIRQVRWIADHEAKPLLVANGEGSEYLQHACAIFHCSATIQVENPLHFLAEFIKRLHKSNTITARVDFKTRSEGKLARVWNRAFSPNQIEPMRYIKQVVVLTGQVGPRSSRFAMIDVEGDGPRVPSFADQRKNAAVGKLIAQPIAVGFVGRVSAWPMLARMRRGRIDEDPLNES